jgi:hypothetical protein
MAVFRHVLSPLTAGDVIPVLTRTAKTDVLVNCARIGFKP